MRSRPEGLVRTIQPWSHEVGANLIFTENGLQPYYAMDSVVKAHGGAVSTSVEYGGETYSITLSHRQSSLLPWGADEFELESVREFNLNFTADDPVGKRGGDIHFAPRWPEMESKEGCDTPSVPGDIIGVNGHLQASNIPIDDYPGLIQACLDALDINSRYFEEIHGYSNIYEYERYLRIRRAKADHLIGVGGILERLYEHIGQRTGSYRAIIEDDTKIEGYNHRVRMDSSYASGVLDGHMLGKQAKCYHPKVPRHDPNDPLYNPKVGILFRKKHTDGGTVSWSDRHELEQELDEQLINLVSWAGLPVTADPSVYAPDEYFEVESTELDISLIDDPTPSIKREQDVVVANYLGLVSDESLKQSDKETVRLLADGGSQTVTSLAEQTEWSRRTIYRVIDRLEKLVSLDNGVVEFASEYLERNVRQGMHDLKEKVDTTDTGTTEVSRWMNRYDVEMDDRDEQLLLRFGVLGVRDDIKEIMREGLDAWRQAGRNCERFREAIVSYEQNGLDYEGQILEQVTRNLSNEVHFGKG